MTDHEFIKCTDCDKVLPLEEVLIRCAKCSNAADRAIYDSRNEEVASLASVMESSEKTAKHLQAALNRLGKLTGLIGVDLDTHISAIETEFSARRGNMETKLDWVMLIVGLSGWLMAIISFSYFYFFWSKQ